MKVSELMVGDWVNCIPDGRKKQVTGKITAMIGEKIIVGDRIHLGDGLSPVVLTPEFLEDVGLMPENPENEQFGGFTWNLETDEFKISVHLDEDPDGKSWVNVMNFRTGESMRYDSIGHPGVHMLQNMVNMIGISEMEFGENGDGSEKE